MNFLIKILIPVLTFLFSTATYCEEKPSSYLLSPSSIFNESETPETDFYLLKQIESDLTIFAEKVFNHVHKKRDPSRDQHGYYMPQSLIRDIDFYFIKNQDKLFELVRYIYVEDKRYSMLLLKHKPTGHTFYLKPFEGDTETRHRLVEKLSQLKRTTNVPTAPFFAKNRNEHYYLELNLSPRGYQPFEVISYSLKTISHRELPKPDIKFLKDLLETKVMEKMRLATQQLAKDGFYHGHLHYRNILVRLTDHFGNPLEVDNLYDPQSKKLKMDLIDQLRLDLKIIDWKLIHTQLFTIKQNQIELNDNLVASDLSGTLFPDRQDFRYKNLSPFYGIRNSFFMFVTAKESDFTGSILPNYFLGSDLSSAKFINVKITNPLDSRKHFPRFDFTNLYNAEIRDSDLSSESDQQGVFFYKTHANFLKIINTNLQKSRWMETLLSGAQIINSDLRGAWFFPSDLKYTLILRTDLRNISYAKNLIKKLSKCVLSDVKISKSLFEDIQKYAHETGNNDFYYQQTDTDTFIIWNKAGIEYIKLYEDNTESLPLTPLLPDTPLIGKRSLTSLSA